MRRARGAPIIVAWRALPFCGASRAATSRPENWSWRSAGCASRALRATGGRRRYAGPASRRSSRSTSAARPASGWRAGRRSCSSADGEAAADREPQRARHPHRARGASRPPHRDGARGMSRVAVVVPLRPDSIETARGLIEAGPPFALERHPARGACVYLTDTRPCSSSTARRRAPIDRAPRRRGRGVGGRDRLAGCLDGKPRVADRSSRGAAGAGPLHVPGL